MGPQRAGAREWASHLFSGPAPAAPLQDSSSDCSTVDFSTDSSHLRVGRVGEQCWSSPVASLRHLLEPSAPHPAAQSTALFLSVLPCAHHLKSCSSVAWSPAPALGGLRDRAGVGEDTHEI